MLRTVLCCCAITQVHEETECRLVHVALGYPIGARFEPPFLGPQPRSLRPIHGSPAAGRGAREWEQGEDASNQFA